MSVTIRDVAKESGYSIATVSRVINGTADVSDETRSAVDSAIKTLGYKVNRRLSNRPPGAIRSIGLLMSDIDNVYYPSVIKGMERELFRSDYNLFVCNTEEDPQIERRYVQSLSKRGVDGIVFLGTRVESDKNQIILELSQTLPVVLINENIVGADIFSVTTDEVEGAYRAIDHLLKLGHRRIAFVHGNGGYTTSIRKYEGYTKALRNAGIAPDSSLVVPTDPHEHGGFVAGQALLKRPQVPSAVFTENDQLAMGIMRSIHQGGLSIPEDISVVGFSDVPIAAEMYPPLTTVNQFGVKTGEMAARLILNVIQNIPTIQRRVLIQPELSIRESTGPCNLP